MAAEERRGMGRLALFIWGLVTGSLVGLIVGSALALWIGDESLELARKGIDRALGRRPRVMREVLLQ